MLNKLKESSAQEEALKATINNASELNIEILEERLRSPRPQSISNGKHRLKSMSDMVKYENSEELSPAKRS